MLSKEQTFMINTLHNQSLNHENWSSNHETCTSKFVFFTSNNTGTTRIQLACGAMMPLPFPRLAASTPKGLETLGVVPLIEELLVVVEVPLARFSVEPALGGPQGFGKGSLFSVLEGWTPGLSGFPPKAEKGLFPNWMGGKVLINVWMTD